MRLRWVPAALGSFAALLVLSAGADGALAFSLGLLLGPGAAFVSCRWMQQARRVPPIRDSSTGPDRPPRFVAEVPLRGESPNPVACDGAGVAEAQSRAYPDIKPLFLSSRLSRSDVGANARRIRVPLADLAGRDSSS